MALEELLKTKALLVREKMRSDALGEAAIEAAAASGQKSIRNICAHISTDLYDQIEEACQFLDLTKRRFVEAALIEAVAKAESIIAEVKPFDLEA